MKRERVDESYAEVMDKLMTIEQDVAAISMHDEAGGKQYIHTQLKVSYIKNVNK